MNDFAFWQQKIIQFFHDPPAKPFGGIPKVSGPLNAMAQRLFDFFQKYNQDRKWRYWFRSADWAAAGADRPMLYVPRKKGVSGLGNVSWPKAPVLTHPLASGARLDLTRSLLRQPHPRPQEKDDSLAEDGPETPGKPLDRSEWVRVLIRQQDEVGKTLAEHLKDWTDAASLRQGFVVLWRRYRADLAAAFPNDPLWLELPADSRCPDHSIWDHLKVTTALAFIKPHDHKTRPADRDTPGEPWMLRVSLGPVGRFIGQSRTTRDLWTSSVLLADLAWHAMQPVVTRYGPDAIVYPDLWANPRADAWLVKAFPDALPEGGARDPATFAAVLPDAFVALVPRGGVGHLQTVEELAQACQQAVHRRWQDLQTCVFRWFEGRVRPKGDGWRAIWGRQHRICPIHVTWTAVPWMPPEPIGEPMSLCGQPLPAQPRRPAINPDDAAAIAARRARLSPWVPPSVWSHYEYAREVYARSCLELHQIERGFDYSLTHHMLRVRHAMREATHPAPVPAAEPGEKCTLCGEREALHDGDADSAAPLGQLRRLSRDFWRQEILDPDKSGAERLCAVCATKRFLVTADQEKDPAASVFNVLWAGPRGLNGTMRDKDGQLRVPFPSTATVAAQDFLVKILNAPACADAVTAVTKACRDAGLPRTSFPRALPRLAALADHAILQYEAQDVLFPEVLEGKARGLEFQGDVQRAQQLRTLKAAVLSLRKTAAGLGDPGTRIAVLHLDGDRMGKLLAGDAEAIAARWRDVVHPEVLTRLPGRPHLVEAGWPALLDQKRLMGPSLHAFVSRALGHYSHRIVPWVVEQEFSGRLIYAGGDDVLCLAPADEALALAARLQQLFSAAWVVDTQPDTVPWSWRGGTEVNNRESVRRRFVIPLPPEPGAAIRLGEPDQPVARHADDRERGKRMEVRGLLLPLLGDGASLSAGIAIGHYKTPLGRLVERSKALETLAKDQGRRAVALGHASRGGVKTAFSLPWSEADDDADGPTAHRTLTTVIEGFRAGHLPGRLPYKLRAMAVSVQGGLEAVAGLAEEARLNAEDRLLRGVFAACLDGSETADAALRVWRRGIDIHRPPKGGGWSLDAVTHFTDGLLVCRELARGDDAGEDEA